MLKFLFLALFIRKGQCQHVFIYIFLFLCRSLVQLHLVTNL